MLAISTTFAAYAAGWLGSRFALAATVLLVLSLVATSQGRAGESLLRGAARQLGSDVDGADEASAFRFASSDSLERLPSIEELPPPADAPPSQMSYDWGEDFVPFSYGSPWQWQTPPGRENPFFPTIPPPPDGSPSWHVDFLARSYYINDARIEYFGTEATFGAEGIIAPVIKRQCGNWDVEGVGEFYINQPFEQNILVDSPERVSHRANFVVPFFSLSQMYLGARNGDWYFAAGKMTTPFGRYWDPLYTNNRHDAPFIRTEAILWRETGVMAQWDPGNWVFTAMLSNGGPDADTNSSKALVARAGYDTEWFSAGMSVKQQDGNGSEGQKMYNNHVGIDAMVKNGGWRLSGEVIRDQYGLRRPGLDFFDITWGRSLYFREVNKAPWQPMTGTGYYVNLAYDGPVVSGLLSYGEFAPDDFVGEPRHDRDWSRFIARVVYHVAPGNDLYLMFLHENDLPNAYQVNRTRQGDELLFGWQFAF